MVSYAVTDIETDGPDPGTNSMRSFATVIINNDLEVCDQFEITLLPLGGAQTDPRTMAWFQKHPESWEHATQNPQPPANAIHAYVDWLRTMDEKPVFAAQPLAFDGYWIDWYLRKFTGLKLGGGPFPDDSPFSGTGLDIRSLCMGVLERDYFETARKDIPESWFGGVTHSHRAIDDAMGYAHVLCHALSKLQAKKK